MFIKKQFENKLNRQTTTTFASTGTFYNRTQKDIKQPKVGSCRLPRMNYERDEQFFPPDYAPIKVKDARNDMRDLIDPDVLSLRKPLWNKSVSVSIQGVEEEDFQRKLTKIRMGLHDHPMPKFKEKEIEEGTDSRNQYTGWNVSTQTLNRFEKAKLLNSETEYALRKTKVVINKLSEYKTPSEKTTILNETMRQKKRDEKSLRDELRNIYEFENPQSTQEKINAGVFRMVHEHKVKNAKPQSEEARLNLTFKPDLTRSMGNTKIKVYNRRWNLESFT